MMYELIRLPMYTDARPMVRRKLLNFGYEPEMFGYDKVNASKYVLCVNHLNIVATEYYFLGKDPNAPIGAQDLYLIHSNSYSECNTNIEIKGHRVCYPEGIKKFHQGTQLDVPYGYVYHRFIETLDLFLDEYIRGERNLSGYVLNDFDIDASVYEHIPLYTKVRTLSAELDTTVQEACRNRLDVWNYTYVTNEEHFENDVDEVLSALMDVLVPAIMKDRTLPEVIDEVRIAFDNVETEYNMWDFDIRENADDVSDESIERLLYLILENAYKIHGYDTTVRSSIITHNLLPIKNMDITGVYKAVDIRNSLQLGTLRYREMDPHPVILDLLNQQNVPNHRYLKLFINEPSDLVRFDISDLLYGDRTHLTLEENSFYVDRIMETIDIVIGSGINNCVIEWGLEKENNEYTDYRNSIKVSYFDAYNTVFNKHYTDIEDTHVHLCSDWNYWTLTTNPIASYISAPEDKRILGHIHSKLIIDDDTAIFDINYHDSTVRVVIDLTMRYVR